MLGSEYGWYLLGTDPVHGVEFDVAKRLNQLERATMVPFEVKAIKRKGRRYLEKVRFPLFTRYVFVQLPTNSVRREYHVLKSVEGSQGLISASRGEVFIPLKLDESQVSFIRTLSESGWGRGATAVALHKAFQPGMDVKPLDGPFMGLPGKIDSLTRKRIKVMMQLFGSQRILEFGPEQLAVA